MLNPLEDATPRDLTRAATCVGYLTQVRGLSANLGRQSPAWRELRDRTDAVLVALFPHPAVALGLARAGHFSAFQDCWMGAKRSAQRGSTAPSRATCAALAHVDRLVDGALREEGWPRP